MDQAELDLPARRPDAICRACRRPFSRAAWAEHLPPWWRAHAAWIPARHCGRWACFAQIVRADGEPLWAEIRALEQTRAGAYVIGGSGSETIVDPRLC